MNDVRTRHAQKRAQLTDHGKPERALIAAGDLWRRSKAMVVDPRAIDEALAALPEPTLAAWVEGLDTQGLRRDLQLAANQDAGGEAESFPPAAFSALEKRDELESARAALLRRQELTGKGAGLAALLKEKLSAVDESCRPLIRRFTSSNEDRRRERDLLDPTHQKEAYWYTERADCDGLLQALSGAPTDSFLAHRRHCAPCQSDVARTKVVDAPPIGHVSAAALLRYEIGPMSESERARIDRHADGCFDCAHALSALADGERAIREAEQMV